MRVCDLPIQYIERGLQFRGCGAGDIQHTIGVEKDGTEVVLTTINLPSGTSKTKFESQSHYWTQCQSTVVLDSLRVLFLMGAI